MDEVAAVTQFRDYVLIVTKKGAIYKLHHSDNMWEVVIHLVHQLELNR